MLCSSAFLDQILGFLHGLLGPRHGLLGPRHGLLGPLHGLLSPLHGLLSPLHGLLGLLHSVTCTSHVKCVDVLLAHRLLPPAIASVAWPLPRCVCCLGFPVRSTPAHLRALVVEQHCMSKAPRTCKALLNCRPLPAGVACCLGSPLGSILTHLKGVFPPAAACLAKQDPSPATHPPSPMGDAPQAYQDFEGWNCCCSAIAYLPEA